MIFLFRFLCFFHGPPSDDNCGCRVVEYSRYRIRCGRSGRGMTKCLAQPKDLMFFENTRASVVGSLLVGDIDDMAAGTACGF